MPVFWLRRFGAMIALTACTPRIAREVPAKTLHHFVFFGQNRELIPHASSFFETKAIEGAQITYSWKQLEPEKDAYDFSMIREDLGLLSSNGKKLFVQIADATFSPARKNVPSYLLTDPSYNGGAAPEYGDAAAEAHASPNGWVARRWDPAVQSRFAKLLAALGREFDGRIEGINLQETSIGFGDSIRLHPKGFSPQIYRDAVIKNMKALKRAFPESVAMQYGNFMPGEWRATDDKGYLRAVYSAAIQLHVAMGGPDLMPNRPGHLKGPYPLLREVADFVPTGLAVQDGNLEEINPETGKLVTPAELVKFAKDSLKLDYIFWGTQEPFYSAQVIPYLRQ